jgi:hypothetical protein
VGQVRQLAADLVATGVQRADMPAPLVMFDAGYDATAIGYELGDLGVQMLTRVSARRVFYSRPPPRPAGKRGAPRHGARLSLSEPADRPPADRELSAVSERYGKVRVQAWHNMHQQLGRSGHWADWSAGKPLPIVAGTVIGISVQRLPAGRKPQRDIWLFHTAPPAAEPDLGLLWKAYLRRFARSTSTASSRSTSAWTPPTWPAPWPPTGGGCWPWPPMLSYASLPGCPSSCAAPGIPDPNPVAHPARTGPG